jgi:hypothetical protein
LGGSHDDFLFKIRNGHIDHGAGSKGNKIYFLLTA